jgi:hypothetical protein
VYCPHYPPGIVANQLKNKKRSVMERFHNFYVSV